MKSASGKPTHRGSCFSKYLLVFMAQTTPLHFCISIRHLLLGFVTGKGVYVKDCSRYFTS